MVIRSLFMVAVTSTFPWSVVSCTLQVHVTAISLLETAVEAIFARKNVTAQAGMTPFSSQRKMAISTWVKCLLAKCMRPCTEYAFHLQQLEAKVTKWSEIFECPFHDRFASPSHYWFVSEVSKLYIPILDRKQLVQKRFCIFPWI